MTVEWRAFRVLPDDPDEQETDLLHSKVTDTFNRFARHAQIVVDNPDGDKAADYPDFQSVRMEVRIDSEPFATRFGGFVIDKKRDGDQLIVNLLSHDLWLRRRDVYRSYTETAALTVLQDVIERFSPLIWDANLIDNARDPTITRRFQGEKLHHVVEELMEALGADEYGATDDGEFFLRRAELTSAPREFTAGEYLDHEFEENAELDVNQIQLFYGEDNPGLGDPDAGKRSVIVDDVDSQAALQERTGAERPVVISATRHYPEITNEDEAETKARAILRERTTITTGRLTTWEAFNVKPGHITRVEIPEEDIDAEFAVARIDYDETKDATTIIVAENHEGVIDVLAELSGEIQRIDSRGSDPDGLVTRIHPVDLPGENVIEIEITKRAVPDDAFLFGEARKGWGEAGKLGDNRGPTEEVVLSE